MRGRPDRFDTPQRRARRYWIPLIGLYTGMRLAEISQLSVSDFVERNEVHCISIAPGRTISDLSATRIKTVAALRSVPIHPELIRLGLLDYVETRRSAGREWLWEGLSWRDKEGFGKYPGRDFQEHTKAVGVYVLRRKVFHRFRSTIQQPLQKVPLEGVLIDMFLGHDVDVTRLVNYSRLEDGTRSYPYVHVLGVLKAICFDIAVPTWSEIQALGH